MMKPREASCEFRCTVCGITRSTKYSLEKREQSHSKNLVEFPTKQQGKRNNICDICAQWGSSELSFLGAKAPLGLVSVSE